MKTSINKLVQKIENNSTNQNTGKKKNKKTWRMSPVSSVVRRVTLLGIALKTSQMASHQVWEPQRNPIGIASCQKRDKHIQSTLTEANIATVKGVGGG